MHSSIAGPLTSRGPSIRSGASTSDDFFAQVRKETGLCRPMAGFFAHVRKESGPHVRAAAGLGAVSERMSIRHPVSRAASRAFWPSRPMARDNW